MLKAAACFSWLCVLSSYAHAAVYPLPSSQEALVGEVFERAAAYEDTFATIAREEGVGYAALRRLNPDVDVWLPGEGAKVVLPTQVLLPPETRQGIVINLSELRLFYFDQAAQLVHVYPIGVGEQGTETPLMRTRVVSKIEDPAWYPTDSVRAKHAARGDSLPAVVLPGASNPLGRYAIQLARAKYFIHGTNQPIGVGQRISAGCIRLYAKDIATLVSSVPNGTEVTVVRQRNKVAWHGDVLYMEAHPESEGDKRDHTDIVRQVIKATRTRSAEIDWKQAMAAARSATGLPVRISL